MGSVDVDARVFKYLSIRDPSLQILRAGNSRPVRFEQNSGNRVWRISKQRPN